MKRKIILYFLFVTGIFFHSGCDEPFSPYGEFQKRYYLNCIVRADTNLQITTLYQSYAPNNKSAAENRTATFIHNSAIRLWRGNDDIYFFRDSSTENSNYYFSKGLIPHPGDNLEIEVILPDGNRLRAKTKAPEKVKKDDKKTSEIIPIRGQDYITFAWKPNVVGQIFVPNLYIYYKEEINGLEVTKKELVPWQYVNGKGINRPPLKDSEINFNLENIEKILKQIGKGKDKNKIEILAAILELRVFDKNLSAYYLSVKRISNDFTVRLDSREFSNIQGGFGIFGSFIEQKIAILFDNEYLTKFDFHQVTL